MDLTTQAHLAAGLGALGLAASALVRQPSLARARLFAALAASLALWNLAAAARHEALPVRAAWRALTFVGACAAAPLAFHLVLALVGRVAAARGRLIAAYAAAALACGLSLILHGSATWLRVAVLAAPLAAIVALAAFELRRHVATPEGSADRRPVRILLVLGAFVVACGVTDLVPRGESGVPPLGPLALVPFLFALATVGLRRRYVDLDTLVARVAAVALAAVAASALLQSAVAIAGASGLTFFLVSLVIVGAAGPLVAAIRSGTHALLDAGAGETARALAAASAELARVEDPAGAWRVLQALAPRLPGGASLVMRLGAEAPPPQSALARILLDDRAPLTRRLLELDAREARDAGRRAAAHAALEQMRALGFEICAPLVRGEKLAGVIALGGGTPHRYVGGEAGAALVALGHQALATLERMEAVEAARRREALAVVGEMAASLAHDVRNPLAAIRGAAQVLAEARNPAQESEMLGIVDRESERLGRILGEFLEWARPRQAERLAVDLADLARRIAMQAQVVPGSPRIELALDPAAPPACGDEELLTRALGNLVRNACDAAGPAGNVRIGLAPAGADRVRLRVEDDGPGLPAGVRERVFEPFVTTKPGGTGLGLALVQRAAAAQGGEVRVEDLPAGGTAFTLVLPAADMVQDGARRRPS